jgi:hypothetical protein
MFFDKAAETATLWINEEQAASVVGNSGWHTAGSFPTSVDRVWFGTLTPDGAGPLLYLDDIAIGPTRLYCN